MSDNGLNLARDQKARACAQSHDWLNVSRACAAIALLGLAVWGIGMPSEASATDAQHEARVRAAEAAYLKSGIPAAQWSEGYLDVARVSNPGVPEANWAQINAEVASLSVAITQSPDSPLGLWLRPEFERLSDQELDRLTVLFSDPILLKYNRTRRNPAVVKLMLDQLAHSYEQNLATGKAVHDVLTKHGLSCCVASAPTPTGK